MDSWRQLWAGEAALRLTALTALLEDLSLTPSTHMVAHSHLLAQLQGSPSPLLAFVGIRHTPVHQQICRQNIHTR